MGENSINSYNKRSEYIKNLSLAITIPSLVIIGVVIDYYYGIKCNNLLSCSGLLSCSLIGIFLTVIEATVWYPFPNIPSRNAPQQRYPKLTKDRVDLNVTVKELEMY